MEGRRHTHTHTHTQRNRQKQRRHFPCADKYATLLAWLGSACLASAQNLIIFVLFYLLPHRQFLLLLLRLLLLLSLFLFYFSHFTACLLILFFAISASLFLPSISMAWPKYFRSSIYTTQIHTHTYISSI